MLQFLYNRGRSSVEMFDWQSRGQGFESSSPPLKLNDLVIVKITGHLICINVF